MTPWGTADSGPVLIGDLHLDRPLPMLGTDRGHVAARLLVRLHGRPIGETHLRLPPGGLDPSALSGAVWGQLHDAVRGHLRQDGLPMPDRLPAAGLGTQPPGTRCRPRHELGRCPAITVAVATRDRTTSLLRFLDSVADLDYPDLDVVVVDSAPADEATRTALHESAPPGLRVRYVREERPGLARAHNAALPYCREIAAFTDDDVQVDPLWLSAVAQTFMDDHRVQCVTGLILPAELETQAQLWVEEAGGFARGFRERRFSLAEPAPDPLFPFTAGRFGSGANMSFRVDWLRRHGGFDPASGAGSLARGGDDLLAFLHVVLSGGVLCYQPAAIVRHWHRRELAGLRRQSFGYGVGLGAYLTGTVARDPSLLAPMAARIWPAIRHLTSRGSAKNRGKSTTFPRELTWLERAGLLTGPVAYARSRHATRRADRAAVTTAAALT